MNQLGGENLLRLKKENYVREMTETLRKMEIDTTKFEKEDGEIDLDKLNEYIVSTQAEKIHEEIDPYNPN